MSLTKLSITIETSVRDKLPKTNKSAFINQILKQHFLKENVDGLYNYIKQRMIKEGLVSDGSVSFDSLQPKQQSRPCCGKYPQVECGHWMKHPDYDELINRVTGETREIG